MAFGSKFKKIWKSLGPGLVTGAADDDPSGVVTYAMAGAKFGTSAVWMMLYLLPFMTVIQEMSARIGISSSCGLAGNLKRYYPRILLIFLSTLIIFANTFNIGADIYGMASALELVIPGPTHLLSWIIVIFILALMILLPYRKIVLIFKWLAFSMLSYMVAALLIVPDWRLILGQLVLPEISFTRDYLLVLVAVIGTTISPYMAVWQSSEEAEEKHDEIGKSKPLVCKYRVFSKKDLDRVMLDTKTGMLFSNLIAFFIISLTGTLLFSAGIRNIETIRDVADALRPLAGEYTYYLFALGIVSAGLLTIPILAGSTAYVLSEIFGWKGSLDKTFFKAKEFYLALIVSAIVGMAIPYIGITAVQALFFTAVINGAIAPFFIASVIHMANNPNIVGPNVNNKSANTWAYTALILVAGLDLAVIVMKFPAEKAAALISAGLGIF